MPTDRRSIRSIVHNRDHPGFMHFVTLPFVDAAVFRETIDAIARRLRNPTYGAMNPLGSTCGDLISVIDRFTKHKITHVYSSTPPGNTTKDVYIQ